MVAALSPADINFEETLGTLRYADRAKQIKVCVEVQENATDKLIRQLKEENDKLKKMMEQMGGDGFDPAMFAGGGEAAGGGGGGAGTISEEEMQEAIEKAVAEVKAASEADKQKAITEVKKAMMARSEGLSLGMISRNDMEQTIVDLVNSCGVDDKKMSEALVKVKTNLDAKAGKRTQNGGTLDPFDAMVIYDDVIQNNLSRNKEPFEAKAKELFGASAPIWSDNKLTVEEMVEAMGKLLDSQKEKVSDQERASALERTRFLYAAEVEAAKSDLHTKASLDYHVETTLQALGVGAAEVAKFTKQLPPLANY